MVFLKREGDERKSKYLHMIKAKVNEIKKKSIKIL